MRDGTSVVRVPAAASAAGGDAPTLPGLGRAMVLELSPDGVRAALVVDGPGRPALYVGTVVRAEDGGVALRDLRGGARALAGRRRGLAGQREAADPGRRRGGGPDRAVRGRCRRLGAAAVPTSGLPSQPTSMAPPRAGSRSSARAAGSGSWPAARGSPSCAAPSRCPGQRRSTRSESAPSTTPQPADVHRLPCAARTGRARRLAGWAGRVVGALADLVLPRTCAGCGLPGAVLCRRAPACSPARDWPAAPVPGGLPADGRRRRLRRAGAAGRARLQGTRPGGAGRPAGHGAGPRGGRGRPAPSRAAGPVVLVPVPSSAAALRARGRDHVRELTGRAVAELRAAGCRRRRPAAAPAGGRVRDSAGLSAAQRRANLAGTFPSVRRARRPPEPLLVLVDDVVTSGATLTEAAAVLGRRPGRPSAGARRGRRRDSGGTAGRLHGA